MSIKDLVDDLYPHKEMQFAPVTDDEDDELSNLMRDDPITHDNQWDLHETIDPDKLDAFWSDAVRELGPLETEQDEG